MYFVPTAQNLHHCQQILQYIFRCTVVMQALTPLCCAANSTALFFVAVICNAYENHNMIHWYQTIWSQYPLLRVTTQYPNIDPWVVQLSPSPQNRYYSFIQMIMIVHFVQHNFNVPGSQLSKKQKIIRYLDVRTLTLLTTVIYQKSFDTGDL